MYKLSVIVGCLFFVISAARAEDMFAKPNPNEGYEKIIAKSQDNSLPLQNTDYMNRSIEGKIKLHLSESNPQSNQVNQPAGRAIGNSVIIGDGVTVNGDLIINNQVNGDTYVSSR